MKEKCVRLPINFVLLVIYFMSELRGTVAFRTVCELKHGVIIKPAFVQWLKEGENAIELLLGI